MLDAPPLNYIFNTKLAPQPPSLNYVSQSMAENVAFTFYIPFPMPKAWVYWKTLENNPVLG